MPLTIPSLSLGLGGASLASQIAGLFAQGEVGAWYDPSDIATLFQDSAGTTPVTATGQPVGKILDKSGRANHATQATAASRPVLQQDATGRYYLDFDGVDDSLATASIDFTGTDKMTVWAGVRKNSDAAGGVVVELSATTASNNGSFSIFAPASASPSLLFQSKGTVLANAIAATGYTAPITVVITGQGDISNDSSILRANAVQAATNVADQGTGNYGNYPVYIGARGGTSARFNGRIYALIVRGAASNAAQVATGESYANSMTGAY